MNKVKEFIKKYWIVLLAVIWIIFMVWLNNSTNEWLLSPIFEKKKPTPQATVQPIIDQKQNMIDSLLVTVNRMIASTNSSKQSIIIQREGFTNNYQHALETSPEICLPTIKIMYRQAMQMDSTSQRVIRKQDSTILSYSRVVGEYSDVMALQKFQIQQKSDSIVQLQEQKKLDKRLARREKVKQVLTKVGLSVFSFGAGYGAGKIIP